MAAPERRETTETVSEERVEEEPTTRAERPSVEEFYRKVADHPDGREILSRLAK
jgi:hypothetical protein